MTAKQFEKLLEDLKACSEAREWSKGMTLEEAWSTCERADWMCWLLVELLTSNIKIPSPNQSIVRHVLCDCAETALKYTTDPRPAEAIRIARLYADGKATDEQLAAASAAASAAAWAAASAAASAATWAAASAAASAATWAAASAAAWAAAWAAALKEMSNLIRKRVPVLK